MLYAKELTMQDPLDDEIDLLEYWNVIRNRKKVLIILFTVSVTVTMVISLLLPKYYKSEAVIVTTASASGGLGAALSSIPFAGALGLQTPDDNVLVFLNSRTISEAVIRKFNLLRVFNESDWDAAKGAWKDPDDPPLMEEAVKQLTEDVVAIDKDKLNAITIDVIWKDPKLAADMANYYVYALNEFMNEKSVNMTIQIVDRAVPAEKKSRPKIALNMALAGIASLFIGVFIAFFQEYLSKQKQLSSVRNKAGNGDGQTSCHDEAGVAESRSNVSP